MFNHHTMIMS